MSVRTRAMSYLELMTRQAGALAVVVLPPPGNSAVPPDASDDALCDLFDERAAILEFDAGMERGYAEKVAAECVGRMCAVCGGQE